MFHRLATGYSHCSMDMVVNVVQPRGSAKPKRAAVAVWYLPGAVVNRISSNVHGCNTTAVGHLVDDAPLRHRLKGANESQHRVGVFECVCGVASQSTPL